MFVLIELSVEQWFDYLNPLSDNRWGEHQLMIYNFIYNFI